MTLIQLKQYLSTVKITSLATLCQYFNAESASVRDKLQHWIRKGCVRLCVNSMACGKTCFKCQPEKMELYEWIA